MPSPMEDKFAIAELIGVYNQSLDRGHYTEFLECWCSDGVFNGLDALGGPFVGLPAIRRFTEGYDAAFRLKLSGLKHFTVNTVSRISGDHARSSSYLQMVCTGATGARILFTGRYEDELRREHGMWRFAMRKLHQDMPPMAAPKA